MTSRTLTLFVVCALAATLFVAPAAAVESTPQDLPEEAEVGGDVKVTFDVTDLFSGHDFEEWTLQGETELEDVTWTVEKKDQLGTASDPNSVDGQQMSADVDSDVDTVTVNVTGTVPTVENYSYDPADRFVLANFTLTRSGGAAQPIDSYQVHHYTAESKEAREAIDSANEAVEASSSDSGQALLNSAISSYENENFQNAIDSAQEAEEEANQDRLLRMGAMGLVGVIVLVVLVGGGYRLYRSRQQGPSRLK